MALYRATTDNGPVTMNGESAEGWYKDPTGHHSERWFSDGTPTALVRDGQVEAHDPLGDAEAQAAASGKLEFVALPVRQPTQAEGVATPPTEWWQVDVPSSDLGLDGAVGYEISLAVRLSSWRARRKRGNSSEE
jgi:hypothetical protein